MWVPSTRGWQEKGRQLLSVMLLLDVSLLLKRLVTTEPKDDRLPFIFTSWH